MGTKNILVNLLKAKDEIEMYEEDNPDTLVNTNSIKAKGQAKYNKLSNNKNTKRRNFIEKLRYEGKNGEIQKSEEEKKLIESGIKEEIVEEIKDFCGNEITGRAEEDLIRAVFYCNHNAHSVSRYDKTEEMMYYSQKIKLLEYAIKNTKWGSPPFDSYGSLRDKKGRMILYFDIPECGQVSFHIPEENENQFKEVEQYKYKWKNVKDEKFPSYTNINNFHDLMIALNHESKDILPESKEDFVDIYPEPINLKKLDKNEKCTCYFMSEETREILNKIKEKKDIDKYVYNKSNKNSICKLFYHKISSLIFKCFT